jgi:hypothetical protein
MLIFSGAFWKVYNTLLTVLVPRDTFDPGSVGQSQLEDGQLLFRVMKNLN